MSVSFSRSFWVNRNGVVPYEPDLHGVQLYKFVGWSVEGLLLVSGDDLEDRGTQHRDIVRFALANHLDLPNRPPDVAGMCERGSVCHWRSNGYGIETPPAYQREIYKALGLF